MRIGSAAPYLASSPSSLPARPLSSAISPESVHASSAPAPPARSLAAEEPAPAERSSDEAATSPQQRAQQERLEQLEIAELAGRDREVRAHEQAHAAVGGSYAGAPSYSFKRGPDGRAYAVGGEVSIDVGPIPDDPAATLSKMEIVQRAALAPAEPSAQDLRVAAQAQALAAQARAELAALQREQAAAASAERRERAEQRESESAVEEDAPAPSQQALPPAPNLELYRRLAEVQAPAPLVDLVA